MTEQYFVETENQGVQEGAPWLLFPFLRDVQGLRTTVQRPTTAPKTTKAGTSELLPIPAFASFNLEVRGRRRPRYMN